MERRREEPPPGFDCQIVAVATCTAQLCCIAFFLPEDATQYNKQQYNTTATLTGGQYLWYNKDGNL
jgi:hypothetical protein